MASKQSKNAFKKYFLETEDDCVVGEKCIPHSVFVQQGYTFFDVNISYTSGNIKMDDESLGHFR